MTGHAQYKIKKKKNMKTIIVYAEDFTSLIIDDQSLSAEYIHERIRRYKGGFISSPCR